MEIKILVKEHQKNDLENFINLCKKRGFEVTREGGGRLPNFSGYYAELKGERWENESNENEALPIQPVGQSLPDDVPAFSEWVNKYFFRVENQALYRDKKRQKLYTLETLLHNYKRAYNI